MKKLFVWVIFGAMLLTVFACRIQQEQTAPASAIADGTYRIEVALSGGTGRATIESPALLSVQNGEMMLTVKWSSDKYDYMLVGGEKLTPEIVDGHSTFVIPVRTLDKPLSVIADTTAMSTPHEIEYTITFDAASLKPAS